MLHLHVIKDQRKLFAEGPYRVQTFFNLEAYTYNYMYVQPSMTTHPPPHTHTSTHTLSNNLNSPDQLQTLPVVEGERV